MPRDGLLIEYEYCTGCQSCVVACKQEHGYPVGIGGIKLNEIYTEGERLRIDYLPFPTKYCDLCAGRVDEGRKAGLRQGLSGGHDVVRGSGRSCRADGRQAPFGPVHAEITPHPAARQIEWHRGHRVRHVLAQKLPSARRLSRIGGLNARRTSATSSGRVLQALDTHRSDQRWPVAGAGKGLRAIRHQ